MGFCAPLFLTLSIIIINTSEAKVLSKENVCQSLLGERLIKEIASYGAVRDDILTYVTSGEFKGKTYDELAKFVDTFGARPSGSEVLEKSIDYIIQLARDEELNDIYTEELEVPHWVRGEEKITMLKPRVKDIALLGLGGSVSTPPEGITAEVIVFNDFPELERAADDEVAGKIVLFVPEFTTYSETVTYRSQSATKAAARGAVASLVLVQCPVLTINIVVKFY